VLIRVDTNDILMQSDLSSSDGSSDMVLITDYLPTLQLQYGMRALLLVVGYRTVY